MSHLSERALAVAVTQLGVTEVPKGSNAGPEVEAYLKSVGLGKGYSWCMAFVYWCTNQASIQIASNNPLKKTAGVLDQLNSRQSLVTKVPVPGDIFIMDFGKGQGHTGFVESVAGNIIHTIEGNTNDDGSREGYEVCKRERNINTIKAFIRS
jgi:hypothetical protein